MTKSTTIERFAENKREKSDVTAHMGEAEGAKQLSIKLRLIESLPWRYALIHIEASRHFEAGGLVRRVC